MRVKIGKYKNWFGPYQLAEALCFWVKPVRDEFGIPSKPRWVHSFGEFLAHGTVSKRARKVGEVRKLGEKRPITWLYKALLELDKYKKRKVVVKIDPWDIHSADHTLAFIILPTLKEYKKRSKSAPNVDDEDVPENLRSISAPALIEEEINQGIPDKNYFERWQWVLDEMIFAFETKAGSLQDWEDQFISGEYDLQFKTINEKGVSEIVKGPKHTMQVDYDSKLAYQQRISNGFRLFGKYYENLWH